MPKNTKKEQPIKDLPVAKTEDVKGGAFAGIKELIAVTQGKASNSNR